MLWKSFMGVLIIMLFSFQAMAISGKEVAGHMDAVDVSQCGEMGVVIVISHGEQKMTRTARTPSCLSGQLGKKAGFACIQYPPKSWAIMYRGINIFGERSLDWLAAPWTYFDLALVFEYLEFGLRQFEDMAELFQRNHQTVAETDFQYMC